MLMLAKSRLWLGVSIGLFVLLLIFALLFVFVYKDDQTSETFEDAELTLTEQSNGEEIKKNVNNYYQSLREESANKASGINSVEDLMQIQEDQQHVVGLALIDSSSTEGDNSKARVFAVYLMSKDTKDGLDATFKCYENSVNDAEKSQCFDRAQELARLLGFIAENENLPSDYLEPIPAEAQEG